MEQQGDSGPPPKPAQNPDASGPSLASLAAQDIAALQARFPQPEYTDAEKAEHVKTLKRRRAERETATQDEIAAAGIRPVPDVLSGRMDLDRDGKSGKNGKNSGEEEEEEAVYSDSESGALPERKKARTHDYDQEASARVAADERKAKLDAAIDAITQRLPEMVLGTVSGKTIIPRAAFLGISRAQLAHSALSQSPTRREAGGAGGHRIDLIASLSASHELALELAKHMRPRDIVSLYCTSRAFHDTLDTNLGKNVIDIAAVQFPEGGNIFNWRLYERLCVPDPAGRIKGAPPQNYMPHMRPLPWQRETEAWETAVKKNREENAALAAARKEGRGPPPGTVRLVASLRWLVMLESRSRAVRDILAVLARQGLRMPPHAHLTLKKLWVILDCGYNDGRLAFLQSRNWFTDADLFNFQMFYIKLNMHFNDPVYGPASQALAQLLLGQKGGLHCLWLLLRRKAFVTDPLDIAVMKVRYDYPPPGPADPRPILGVAPADVGTLHREGWGVGNRHLQRPDQLIPREATRRGIALDRFAIDMLLYGHVDVARQEMLCPTEEEMYMSDDDEEGDDGGARGGVRGATRSATRGPCGNVPFRADDWLPRHAAKKRWATLSKLEKLQIHAAEEQEQLRDLIHDRDSHVFPLSLDADGGDGGIDSDDDGDDGDDGGDTHEAGVGEIVEQVLALYGFELASGESAAEQAAALAPGDDNDDDDAMDIDNDTDEDADEDASESEDDDDADDDAEADAEADMDEDVDEDVDEDEDADEDNHDNNNTVSAGTGAGEDWEDIAQQVGIDALGDASDTGDDVPMSTYDFRQF